MGNRETETVRLQLNTAEKTSVSVNLVVLSLMNNAASFFFTVCVMMTSEKKNWAVRTSTEGPAPQLTMTS